MKNPDIKSRYMEAVFVHPYDMLLLFHQVDDLHTLADNLRLEAVFLLACIA